MNKRLKAGALIVTIFVVTVISLICLAFLWYASVLGQYRVKFRYELRNEDNFQSAVNIYLSDSINFLQTRDTIDLFNEGGDSVVVWKKQWGIFEQASIVSYNKFSKKERSFLTGKALPEYMEGCLYLANHFRPLTLGENTRLIGDVRVPKEGIKYRQYQDEALTHKAVLVGQVFESRESLPPLDSAGLKILELYQSAQFDSLKMEISPINNTSATKEKASFSSAPKCFTKSSILDLNGSYSGNIVIYSDSVINVMRSCSLENVLLVAPIIHFENGFRGKVQAFARDSIVVDSNCRFLFPSALVLNKGSESKIQNAIIIENNCIIDGYIIAFNGKDDFTKSLVELKENTGLRGVLYNQGYSRLKSNITGAAITEYFLQEINYTTYENTLLNVTIDRRSLPEHFLCATIFTGTTRKEIVEWLP